MMFMSRCVFDHVHPIFTNFFFAVAASQFRNLAHSCGPNLFEPCASVQSTTMNGFVANLANDGAINWDNGFAQTLQSESPWWRVELKETVLVASGKIWGRADCCQYQLDGFEIWVGDSANFNGEGNLKCFTATSTEHYSPPFSHNFECGERGRFLFVALPGSSRILALNEVEVYSSAGDDLLFPIMYETRLHISNTPNGFACWR